MKEINLLVGGPKRDWPVDFEHILATTKDEIWVGADLGAVELVKHGIKPALAVGDFDTATKEQLDMVLANSQQSVVDPLKDDITDTEMALRYSIASFSFSQINVYGATGARLDQFLANLFLVLKPEFKEHAPKIVLKDRYNEVRFYLPGKHCITKVAEMKYLAFVPLTRVQALAIKDAKYTLEPTNFNVPNSLSSNEFVSSNVNFSFDSGVVAVIQSKD